MFEELESIILGCIFFDEKKEFVNLDELNEGLFENKSLFKKIYQWRYDGKPYDIILAFDAFTPAEIKILNAGVDTMVHIRHYPQYFNLFKRKVLEYQMSVQIEQKEINPETLKQYIETVNNVSTKETVFDYSDDLHSYLDRFQERVVGKFERYKFHMAGFDEVMGYVRPKRFYTIGARSGVGKTNLMLEIMIKQMANDVSCLYVTAEMDYDSLVERMGAINSGLRLFDITNAHLKPEHITEYVDSLKKNLYDKKSFIYETPKFNVNKLEKVIDKTKTKFIFVDYLQKFNLDTKHGETRASVMSDIANGMKEIAMEKNVVVFAGCQLGKNASRENPQLSDLKESGGIEEASDGIILIGEIAEDNNFKKLRMGVDKNKYGITERFAYIMNRKSCAMEYSHVDTEALKGK